MSLVHNLVHTAPSTLCTALCTLRPQPCAQPCAHCAINLVHSLVHIAPSTLCTTLCTIASSRRGSELYFRRPCAQFGLRWGARHKVCTRDTNFGARPYRSSRCSSPEIDSELNKYWDRVLPRKRHPTNRSWITRMTIEYSLDHSWDPGCRNLRFQVKPVGQFL